MNTSNEVPTGRIVLGDNLEVLKTLADRSIDLIYIDPPFNTGRTQRRTILKTEKDPSGNRTGYGGNRYRTIHLGSSEYADVFDDYLGFLEPRLLEAKRILSSSGSLFFHIDYREVHYCKVLLDQLFGRASFMNEIIWAYDYGARSKKKWSAKHDNILWYAKDPDNYTFDFEAMDRIPYMAPGLVGKEKAAKGKTPTDVWWHTIVPPAGKERTGYATQKPLGVLERIVKVHSKPKDLLLDFFAGSGTLGEAAAKNGRRYLLVDSSEESVTIMAQRLAAYLPVVEGLSELPVDLNVKASRKECLLTNDNKEMNKLQEEIDKMQYANRELRFQLERTRSELEDLKKEKINENKNTKN